MFNICIVEDDIRNKEHLCNFLKEFQKDISEEISIVCFSNGLNFIEEYKPVYDVIFMDIGMPLMNGMEAAKKLRERDEKVDLIFMTILSQYSLFGYDVNASAFIIKPFDENILREKLLKIYKRRKRDKEEGWIFSTDGTHIRVLNSDITYIESQNHYCFFHTKDNNSYKKLIAIKEVEKKLEGTTFLRTSGSFIINPSYIEKWQKDSIIISNKVIPISRNKRKSFFEQLTKVFGEEYQ